MALTTFSAVPESGGELVTLDEVTSTQPQPDHGGSSQPRQIETRSFDRFQDLLQLKVVAEVVRGQQAEPTVPVEDDTDRPLRRNGV